MAKFICVLVAMVQYALGFYIFKSPDLRGCGPLLSSMMVVLAMGLVLWSLPLYPKRLRKLWIGNGQAQYFLTVFFLEYIMGCFWFPLETTVLALLPSYAMWFEMIFLSFDYELSFEFIKKEGTGMFVSYLLSFLILVSALHATRMINLSLLSCGISPFMADVARRLRRFMRNAPFIIGIPALRPRRSNKPEYCTSDDETFEFEPDERVNCSPTRDSEYRYSYR